MSLLSLTLFSKEFLIYDAANKLGRLLDSEGSRAECFLLPLMDNLEFPKQAPQSFFSEINETSLTDRNQKIDELATLFYLE